MNPIELRYREVQERILAACQQAGRPADSVRLIVVTKGHPLPAVMQVIQAGARCLGENYVEEAVQKINAIQDVGLEWRMIGHVQSRKAEQVALHFAACDAVDSLKLAGRLDRSAAQAGRILPVLLECNVSGEASKFGWPAWDEAGWPDLAGQFAQLSLFQNIKITGLMTMPPFFDEPDRARPYFQRLRRLQDFLAKYVPAVKWNELSMGMSGDYEAAIQEGASMLRIGTAIMGPRL